MPGLFPSVVPIPGQQSRPDLVDLLQAEHARIRDLLAALDRATSIGATSIGATSTGATSASGRTNAADGRAGELADLAVTELSRQVSVERRFLVPMVRDNLADPEADQLLVELAELEELVRQLYAQASATGPGIGGRVLQHRLRRLAEDRERHLYPRLRAACDRERSRESAQRARAARATAPTRPRPRVPDRPAWSRMSTRPVGTGGRYWEDVSGRPVGPPPDR